MPQGLRQRTAHNEPIVCGKWPLLVLSLAAASLGPASLGGELLAGEERASGRLRKGKAVLLLRALVQVSCISTAPSSAC